MYAYATDGQGTYRFYHDANDIPLVLAPGWRFAPADDPVWRATVDFAFSAANEGGFYASGLGSVHTPAPWPLGDVQDLIAARALGDEDRARRAWDRLHTAARWDGALPEASHAETTRSCRGTGSRGRMRRWRASRWGRSTHIPHQKIHPDQRISIETGADCE